MPLMVCRLSKEYPSPNEDWDGPLTDPVFFFGLAGDTPVAGAGGAMEEIGADQSEKPCDLH